MGGEPTETRDFQGLVGSVRVFDFSSSSPSSNQTIAAHRWPPVLPVALRKRRHQRAALPSGTLKSSIFFQFSPRGRCAPTHAKLREPPYDPHFMN